MYSKTIKPKVDAMFGDLRTKVFALVNEASSSNEAVDNVTKLVSSELTARSKSIMSDMLFELTDSLMETDFFADIARQNRFSEINLRQEILSKYQFTTNASVSYKEASKAMQAVMVGGAMLVIGGAAEVGVVLISGLSISSLVPIPIGILIAASIGAAMAEYYAFAPARNRKALAQALDEYLTEAQQQFLNWFDEVEIYFNMRVEEIKQTMCGGKYGQN